MMPDRMGSDVGMNTEPWPEMSSLFGNWVSFLKKSHRDAVVHVGTPGADQQAAEMAIFVCFSKKTWPIFAL